jgi:hypothetical protein
VLYIFGKMSVPLVWHSYLSLDPEEWPRMQKLKCSLDMLSLRIDASTGTGEAPVVASGTGTGKAPGVASDALGPPSGPQRRMFA